MTDRPQLAGLPLVLAVGDLEGTRWLEELLTPNGFAVLQAATGHHALARARSTQPDAIFVDAVLPDLSGLELCRTLRAEPRVPPSTPIVVTTPHAPTLEQRLSALRAGAWDCVGRAAEPGELLLKLDAWTRAKLDADRARAEGLVDSASGLYNRQGMARRARELGSQAFREHGALACVAFALDLERPPVTAPGEPVAAALQRSVQALKATGRLSDVIGRLGVAEFAVLAPATDAIGAQKLAERMVRAIHEAAGGTAEAVPLLQVRVGYDAVTNVGYAPLEPTDLLVRASAALRRGTPVSGASWMRRYDEGPVARSS